MELFYLKWFYAFCCHSISVFYFEKVMMAAVESCTFHGSPHTGRGAAALMLGWDAPRGTVYLQLVLTRNSSWTGTHES